MSAPPISLENLRWQDETFAGYHASLDSLEDLLDSSATSLPARFLVDRILEHAVEMGPSISVICIAFDAGEPVGSIKPTEEYLADVSAAIAAQIDETPIAVELRHGWPILSPGGVTAPGMAETAGAGNIAFGPGRGGAAS